MKIHATILRWNKPLLSHIEIYKLYIFFLTHISLIQCLSIDLISKHFNNTMKINVSCRIIMNTFAYTNIPLDTMYEILKTANMSLWRIIKSRMDAGRNDQWLENVNLRVTMSRKEKTASLQFSQINLIREN